jgi:anaerobic ribonucleoside-triphosphate reductase activating protein
MRIAGTLSCSLVNGDGVRYVIFCQGCVHHCVGCQNPETWDFNGGKEVTLDELAADISKHKHIDGVTLSGGEPFCQQDECVSLLKLLPENLNVWIYTGYKYDEIKDTELAKMANYIVDGRFEQDKAVTGKMYGSSNQQIIEKRVLT